MLCVRRQNAAGFLASALTDAVAAGALTLPTTAAASAAAARTHFAAALQGAPTASLPVHGGCGDTASLLAAAGAPQGAAAAAWEVSCLTMALPDRAVVPEGAPTDVSVADLLSALREDGFLLGDLHVLSVTQVWWPRLNASQPVPPR
jgi:hypothetical protein